MPTRATEKAYVLKTDYLEKTGSDLVTDATGKSAAVAAASAVITTPVPPVASVNTAVVALQNTLTARVADPHNSTLANTEISQTTVVHDMLDAWADQVEYFGNTGNPGDKAAASAF